MKKKITICFLILCLTVSCMIVFTACFFGKEKADPTLYHLTLSSNMTLNDEQKAQLKATYGYGEPSTTVKKGVRDEEEIKELKKAGATDEDIEKAGTKQSDGSYYFFDQDPIYLEAPEIEGYKLLGFYDKSNNELVLNPILQNIDGGKYLPRYNMDNKNVEIEARYQKWTYEISFDTMDENDSNPNTINSYCFIDNGVFTLAPATTTNKFKTFIGWEYQDYNSPTSEWITLENSTLPSDYYEEYMRIRAVWEIEKFTINFVFENSADLSTLNLTDVCDTISVKGNITTVDNKLVIIESAEDRGEEINGNSVIKIEYNSWLIVYITPKQQYEIISYRINDGELKNFDSNYGYISINEGDITENSTITFVINILE